jgi:hypothetical protein
MGIITEKQFRALVDPRSGLGQDLYRLADIMKVAHRQSLLEPEVRSLEQHLISDDVRGKESRWHQDAVA